MNQILVGDARTRLQSLEDNSVHCCVTSPPYFGLRNYGNDAQIGLEDNPNAYVDELVKVFREVRRVLRSDGTLWLNLGDSYASQGGPETVQTCNADRVGGSDTVGNGRSRKAPSGLKVKDLIGIPWMVAFALRADGWYLRSEIIWAKPNPMPESVTDRPTKAHEQIFLLSKSQRYFYDKQAIAEESVSGDMRRPYGSQGAWEMDGRDAEMRGNGKPRAQILRAHELFAERNLGPQHLEAIRAVGLGDTGKSAATQSGTGKNIQEMQVLAQEAKDALGGYYREFLTAETRNARSVWTIPPKPFSGAHFATFPPDLAARCIKAGCPEGGTVLDPFFGAGTTGLVAQRLGRNFIGVELNPDYAEMARLRILNDAPMFNECEVTA